MGYYRDLAENQKYLIIEHGQKAAKGWLENPSEREYWKGRYFGLQALYKDVVKDMYGESYADFNNHCGVYVNDGEITEVRLDTQTIFD